MNCPKGEGECEYFGSHNVYCPYAAWPLLEERRFNRDCELAPKRIWEDFKTLQERIDWWKKENGLVIKVE